MTAPAIAIGGCALTALLALILSVASRLRLARGFAIASLWLALAAVPASLAWDFFAPPLPDTAGVSEATKVGRVISNAINYGTLVIPFAGLAMFAMRRASAKSERRRAR